MDATDRLRQMLDEQGIKWRTGGVVMERTTWIKNGYYHSVKTEPYGENTLKITAYDIAPDQIIYALSSEGRLDDGQC